MNGNQVGDGCAKFAQGQAVRQNSGDAESLETTGGGCGDTTGKAGSLPPALLDVRVVATMLSMSERSVWRLSDAGKLPAPVRIGRMVRWSRSDIMQWVNDGCPAIRTWRRSG
jgi:predicted DNA-binding transcriptional regulator AlpA